MPDLQNDLNYTVVEFVTTIIQLVRRATIETLESAFGGRVARNGDVAAAVNGAANGAVNGARGVERWRRRRSAGRPPGTRSKKRTPGQMQTLSEQFTKFVRSNPGLRIEQINRQLGTTTKDLALPIRKLVAESVIQAQGQRRSTKYFIAS